MDCRPAGAFPLLEPCTQPPHRGSQCHTQAGACKKRSVVVRHVEASQYGEVGCHGVDEVLVEYCVAQGRGRACEEACSDGLGHNENLRRFPLGPCRGGVHVGVAESVNGRRSSLQWQLRPGLGCCWLMPCAFDEGDSACGSAFGRTWAFHHCTGSSAPWRRHSHTFGGVLEEDTRGAAPCEAEEESPEEVGAGESNQAEAEEANEEGKKALRDAWRYQSAAKNQKWVGAKTKDPLSGMVWLPGMKRGKNRPRAGGWWLWQSLLRHQRSPCLLQKNEGRTERQQHTQFN